MSVMIPDRIHIQGSYPHKLTPVLGVHNQEHADLIEKTFGLTGDLGVGMFKLKLIATIIGLLLVLPLVDCRGEPAVQEIVPFDTVIVVLWNELLDDSTSTVDTVIWSCWQGVQEDIRDVG